MNLRQRLSLSIIAVLILFAINAGMAFWNKEIRYENINQLRQAVSGQFQAATIRQNLSDLRKAVLLLSSLRSTLNENLTPQEIAQAISEINNLELQLQKLGQTVTGDTAEDYQRLNANFTRLKPLWSKFYNRYNQSSYDHYREGDFREQYFIATIEELTILESALIKSADSQSAEINQVEDWTSKITAAVLLSLPLGLALPWFAIPTPH
jgi:hypothetical protein